MVRPVHSVRDSQHGAKLVGIPSISIGCTIALRRAAKWGGARGRSLFVAAVAPRDKLKVTRPRRGTPAWRRSPNSFRSYFAGTTRLFFTENTFGTPLARRPARFLSVSLSATPSSVTFPLFTMI
jgi:hypothetical protein